jgi:hypothetical protein
MLSPVDINSLGNTSTKSLKTLADDAGCVLERMLVRAWRNGKNRASALGVDWTCRQEMQDTFLVETLLYKEILIHQDCYRQFR